jgi:hypothetical protein
LFVEGRSGVTAFGRCVVGVVVRWGHLTGDVRAPAACLRWYRGRKPRRIR